MRIGAPPAAPVADVGLSVSRIESRQRRTALALALISVAWNSLEAVIAIVAGAAATSIALVGFGLNSIVEVGSAVVSNSR